MSAARHIRAVLMIAVVAAVATAGTTLGHARAMPQAAAMAPTNDAPNPYQSIEGWAKLPEGRTWGSTSAVDIDKDGKSIWVAERCGTNSCLDRATGKMSDLPTVLKFDANGKLVKSFGAGLMIFPHGIHVDRDGNVWVTDGQDNGRAGARRGAGGAARRRGGRRRLRPRRSAGGPIGPRAGATNGNQVFKFSPDGKLLLTLGKPGGAAATRVFLSAERRRHVAPNGDIFVAEGHGARQQPDPEVRQDRQVHQGVGQAGHRPRRIRSAARAGHDSRGRLFVGDRNNNRIQIFDQNGKFIEEWKQFSRPSGVYIDKNDMIYVADSESESVSRNHNGWKRGIRVGRVKDGKDGKVVAFIPDPDDEGDRHSAAEGVVVDAQGNIYGAEVGPKRLMRNT